MYSKFLFDDSLRIITWNITHKRQGKFAKFFKVLISTNKKFLDMSFDEISNASMCVQVGHRIVKLWQKLKKILTCLGKYFSSVLIYPVR